ncbi:CLUMA_CG010739, isoform A [Clunio marinus]|uniref:CLUMA_CG010739, isoform A n=1 Tax=Clunio marinus TaxID=568069 RepID=A0A1J1ICR8_9DIPT|nr:CLUMA_CG010739, isoform A [Clunio marinus]
MTEQGTSTTRDNTLEGSIENIFRLMNNYENLVMEIEAEQKRFRYENQHLKESLVAIIEENKRLKSEEQDDPLGAFKNDYIKVADNIFNNLRNQIQSINQEKEMFERLWKKTATILEQEVPLNSMTKIKSDYELELKRVKEELLTTTNHNEQTNKINGALQVNIKNLIKKVDMMQSQNKSLSEKLKTSEDERKELEACLEDSNELNKEQMKKATESLQKLQETIKVADEAMAEIDTLMKEKHQMQEECDSLAHTIGSVMESASEKISKEIEDLKFQHLKDLDDSKAEMERLKQMLMLEKAKTEIAEQKAKTLEEKLKSLDMTQTFCDEDIKTAIQTIEETNSKILSMKRAIEVEKEHNKTCIEEIQKLNKIIENNHKYKNKWKVLLMDITKKLEDKINRLVVENQELRTSIKGRRK